MTIKQHGGVFGRNPSFNDVSVETLSIAGTALASTAAELNILDGVTADATELNYLDGSSTSAVVASKAVLANSSGNIAFPSGKGIDFSDDPSAAGMTSELLDDYEEGTFTPNLTFGGANVAMVGTFTGNYTKIGKQVTVDIRVVLTAKGTSTGIAVIGGLPFVASANPCAVIDASSGVSGPATTWLGAVSASDIFLFRQDATTRTLYTQANFTDTADFRLGLTYLV